MVPPLRRHPDPWTIPLFCPRQFRRSRIPPPGRMELVVMCQEASCAIQPHWVDSKRSLGWDPTFLVNLWEGVKHPFLGCSENDSA